MGTSASSNGPGGGVPLVPPWVSPLPVPPTADDTPATGDTETGMPNPDGQTPQTTPVPIPPAVAYQSPLAAAARFGGARRSLGQFAGGGDSRDMRRGLHHYVASGYGGSGTATRRFGGTASTANALYGALAGGGTGSAVADIAIDPLHAAGRSARDVIDAIIEAVRPADGTQDAEASRAAIKDALSELLTIYPEADLVNLTEDQRITAIERFVAIDVYRRFHLDIGRAIQEKAPNAAAGLARLKEVKNYIKESVAAAFRTVTNAGQRLTAGRVAHFVRSVLTETFQVFEGYLQ